MKASIVVAAMASGSASSTPTGNSAVGCVMPAVPQPKARPQPKAHPESIRPSSAEFQERVAAVKAIGLQAAFNWSLCVCDKPEHDPTPMQKIIWSTWSSNLPAPPCWRAADDITFVQETPKRQRML